MQRRRLCAQFDGLTLLALQKKTVSAGIGEEALEAAMEASDVKGALVALLVSASRHSSYERTVR